MKNKFLIPVLAAIFAIGMSFTTGNKVGDPNMDYYLENGVFKPIGQELNCQTGSQICRVQLEENGTIFNVYDDEDPNTLKEGSGEVIRVWQ